MCQSRYVEINVAADLSNEGHFKQAQSLLESSLRDSISANGPMHRKTICLERNIASILIEQGQVAKAEEICHKAVSSIEQLSPAAAAEGGAEAHLAVQLEVACFKAILANIHLEKRQYVEAEACYREAIRRQEELLGLRAGQMAPRDDLLGCYAHLGRALLGLERFDESERVLRATLEQYTGISAAAAAEVTVAGLGDTKAGKQTADEDAVVPLSLSAYSSAAPVSAAEAQEQLLQKWDAVDSLATIATLRCMDALATCLMLRGYSEGSDEATRLEAAQLFRRIQRAYSRNRKFGPDHRLTLRAGANLGCFLESLGEDYLTEAEETLTLTLERQRASVGPHHPDTLITMSYLGELYDNYGFTEEALRLWQDSVQAHVAVYGDTHVDTVRAKQHLAGLLVTGNDYEEANRLMAEVTAYRAHELGEAHYDTFSARKALAETWYGLQQFAEAEEQYKLCLQTLSALRMAADAGREDHDLMFDTLTLKGSMGLLYMSMSTAAGVGQGSMADDAAGTAVMVSRPGGPAAAASALKREYETKAYSLLKESCDGLRRGLGEDDLHYLRALGNLATYHLTVSDHDPALGGPAAGVVEAVDVSKLERGSAGGARAGVGSGGHVQGNLRLAEEMLRTVIEGMTVQLGPQHDYTIGYSSNLAMLLFNEQRAFAEAAELFRNVCEVFAKKYSYKHAKTLTVLYPLSICLAYSGQIDEATHCAVVYCEHCKELYGEQSQELTAGLAILDQLRNYKITPSKDRSPDLTDVYGTNDVAEDVRRRADSDDLPVVPGDDEYDFDAEEDYDYDAGADIDDNHRPGK